jgi:galactonate dehydratase
MKITEVRTFLVREGHRNLVFVKVMTDEGIHGIGEAYSCGPDDATALVVHHFEEWLIGQDPRNVEHLWQLMYNGSRFPGGSLVNSAISGIEHALWDIKGKALGAPVWSLLGGRCREKVRIYQGAGGATPEELAENGRRLVEQFGYTALKISPHPPGSERMPWNAVLRGAAARLSALRDAVGLDVDIGVDPHAKIFEPVRALQMAQALQPFQPYFFEEPTRPENADALARLRAQVEIPIATGEMLYTKFEFRDLLVKDAVDIVQPDICCAGGILECKKIAALAEAFYCSVAPHNPMGPLATVINVHLAACIPNFLILEYIPDDSPARAELIQEPLRPENGYLPVPEGPGWGVELNEEAFAKYPFRPWHRGFPFREDGSMAFI